MDDQVAHVVDRLLALRALPMLRLIDDAQLDDPTDGEPDAGALMEPYRWLVERVGEGLTLTAAGYLPPAVVVEGMTALGWMDDVYGRANREDGTPMLELRESAQRFGLLRKNRGQLLVTKVGRAVTLDPEKLWWHVASRLPDARSDAQRDAGVIYLLTVAAGRPPDNDLLAQGLTMLGWTTGERLPLSASNSFSAARDTWALFRRLGLINRTDRWFGPELPPSPAAIRLARAALLGHVSPVPGRAAPPDSASIVQLTITLQDIDPPIWRRLAVPAGTTLEQLHEIIQVAMGWQNYHLHMFEIGPSGGSAVLYGDIDEIQGRELGDENKFTIGDAAKVVQEFTYEYDFGDSWQHDIRIEQVTESTGAAIPRLIDGGRACPPEDCGGVPGYEELLEVLADPTHEEYEDMRTWTGVEFDPETFDVVAANINIELVHRLTRRPGRS